MMPVIEEAILAVSNSLATLLVAKVTFVTALGLIGAWLARRNRAAVRRAILAAAFGVLLTLPITSILAPPVRVAVPVGVRDRAVLPPLDAAIDGIPPVTATHGRGVTPRTQQSSRLSRSALLMMGWIAGAMLSLLRMIVGLWRVRSLRRAGLPWAGGQSIVDGLAREAGIHRRVEVLLHEASPGPMTCGLRHPAIVLSPDVQTWEEEELSRALVHELEHVRRSDWVSQCLVRAARAVYWFHPLVWMAWRQIALEAERSCDDAVLGRSEGTVYADQLVTLARRLSMAAKTPLLAMANRADLAARVGAVLDCRQPRGRAGRFALALACAAAAVLVITMSPLRMVAAPQSASGRSFSQPQDLKTQAFEVASVKMLPPQNHPQGFRIPSPDIRGVIGNRFTESNITVTELIMQAYNIKNSQIFGLPSWGDWLGGDQYQVVAKTEGSGAPSVSQVRLMLQSLLAERFRLKVHRVVKELPVYELMIDRNGPKLSTFSNATPLSNSTSSTPKRGMPIAMEPLVELIALHLDRPVLDRTGLTGEFHLDQVSLASLANCKPGDEAFDCVSPLLQEQLGLKLNERRDAIDALVVERVERPAGN